MPPDRRHHRRRRRPGPGTGRRRDPPAYRHRLPLRPHRRHDGISRFTAGVVAHLPDRHDYTLLVHDERQLESLPDGLVWELLPAPTEAGEPLVARKVNRLGLDAVFSPMQTMGSRGRDYALVLTLHDLIYYRNRTPPREFSWPIRLGWRAFHLSWAPQRLLLNGADGVVTVSETTAGLIEQHRLTKRPVTVAYNAADPAERRPMGATGRRPSSTWGRSCRTRTSKRWPLRCRCSAPTGCCTACRGCPTRTERD
ncbi:glycosyltransferase [Curtobacterium flaccumfaciens]|nr:glycosyltransferase [Curtobacterium flaccumfaciens]